MNDIILYTTHCPKCNVLEAKLKAKNVSYYVCEDLDIMEQKGFMTAPMLDTGNNLLDFTGALNWLKEYDETGGDCNECRLG